MKPTPEDYEKAKKLAGVMGGSCSVENSHGSAPVKFVVTTYSKDVNLGTLMKICATLECKPEELFFNADTRSQGYCETCYSTYPVLEVWVSR